MPPSPMVVVTSYFSGRSVGDDGALPASPGTNVPSAACVVMLRRPNSAPSAIASSPPTPSRLIVARGSPARLRPESMSLANVSILLS